jgi:2-phospho-L-lactate guanylyltransferase (CobY/MobA/RfbA family)
MTDATRHDGSLGRARLWLSTAVLAVSLSACFGTHGPVDSTETGNPPVIDSRRVALEISADAVHVMGKKGAVTPGGASIEVTDLATGAVTKGKANADGSFDVKVSGAPNDAFTVSVSAGGVSSKIVYVVQGGSAVGGANGSLSCQQREDLAAAQLAAIGQDVAAGCTTAQDCEVVTPSISCAQPCANLTVSKQGKAQLAAASRSIDDGLCASYVQDGCPAMQTQSFCNIVQAVKCSAGQCLRMGQQAALSCQEREQMAADQLATAIDAADKSCKTDSDCVSVPTVNVCHDACGPVAVSQAGKATIDAAVASVNGGVCNGFMSDGCQFQFVPCTAQPAGPLTCSNGQCAFGPGGTAPAGDECVVAQHLDACCATYEPVLRSKLASDECLVEVPVGSVDRARAMRCQQRSGLNCSVIDCAPEVAPSRVAASDGAGGCRYADECQRNEDCAVAFDARVCCACRESMPVSLLTSNACLLRDGAATPAPASCTCTTPVQCGMCAVPPSAATCSIRNSFSICQ